MRDPRQALLGIFLPPSLVPLRPRGLLRGIAGDAHFRTVKRVEPQSSWVRVLACLKIRACATFCRLAQCLRSPQARALLLLAAGHGRAVVTGRLTRRSRPHSALASRWPGPRCARAAGRWAMPRALLALRSRHGWATPNGQLACPVSAIRPWTLSWPAGWGVILAAACTPAARPLLLPHVLSTFG
jgi:hypothetical protein